MPLSKEYLLQERVAMRGVRFVLQNDVKHMRAAMAASEAATEPDLPEASENIETQDIILGDLSIEVFTPSNGAATGRPMPIMVYYFGGGLVLKSREWPMIERLCEMGQFIIVFPNYRLAPENPWPAGMDDSFAAYEWAHEHASSLGGDPDAMFTAGPSAGGLLAFNVARRVLLTPTLRGSLKGVMALVPATVHRDCLPYEYIKSYDDYAKHPDRWENTVSIDRNSLRLMWEAARFPSFSDPDIWPLHSAVKQDVKYPAVVFVLAGCDPLFGDGKLMATALRDAGTPVKTLCYPDLFHNFWNFPLSGTRQLLDIDLPAALAWLSS